MTWLYGFRFKYRYTKRIGEELGYRCTSASKLDFIAERHIKRVTKAPFVLSPDYRQWVILAFVEVKRRGDLRDLDATPDQIKAVGRILHGDELGHEPTWYSDDPDDAPSDTESEDDDPLPLKPIEFYKRVLPHLFSDAGVPSPCYSTNRDLSTHHKRILPIKKVNTGRRRMRVMSAGRIRKISRQRVSLE